MKRLSNNCKLTIFILSKDKNLVLNKLLEYWKNSGFKIVVLHETKTPINFYCQNSSVLYLPSCDPLLKRIQKMSALVETDYVLISPDDEVFSIPSIIEGIKFLDENPVFSTIGGQAVAVSKYANKNSYFSIYRNYLEFETSSEDSVGRMRESIEKTNGAMGIGAPYRIMRRTVFKSYMEAIHYLSPLSCVYIYEVLAEVYQHIHGRVKILDSVFWIRNWIIPASLEINRKFYYFQWWEDSLYASERQVLVNLLYKQFNELSPKDLDKILELAYSSRKKTELLEYARLMTQNNRLKKFKRRLSRFIFIQRMNFNYKSNSIYDLQKELENHKVRFDKKELLKLTNFVINL